MRLSKWLPLALCTSVQATPQMESACAKTGLPYAHYADSGQTEEFVSLFAEVAVWQISSGVYQGRAAIAAQVMNRDGQPIMVGSYIDEYVMAGADCLLKRRT